MFKCATRWIQQTPCSAAPIRTTYNGPGRLGEWNTRSRNHGGSSSGYGASRSLRVLTKYPLGTAPPDDSPGRSGRSLHVIAAIYPRGKVSGSGPVQAGCVGPPTFHQ